MQCVHVTVWSRRSPQGFARASFPPDFAELTRFIGAPYPRIFFRGSTPPAPPAGEGRKGRWLPRAATKNTGGEALAVCHLNRECTTHSAHSRARGNPVLHDSAAKSGPPRPRG